MRAIPTTISGLFVIETTIRDEDGVKSFETYNKDQFYELGLNMVFVQENQSMSRKGVLRGLHVQKSYPQGKLVRVIQGEIYDVAVDVRIDSKSYGKWFGTTLSGSNCRQLYIPEGFAHGFYVLSNTATVCFKVSNFWHPNDEIGIPWNDKTLDIKWPLSDGVKPIVAEKDEQYEPFSLLKDKLKEGTCRNESFTNT